MSAFLIIAAAIFGGFLFGSWLGAKWGALPRLHPGAIVRFRAEPVGAEYRLRVRAVTRDHAGVTVELESRP